MYNVIYMYRVGNQKLHSVCIMDNNHKCNFWFPTLYMYIVCACELNINYIVQAYCIVKLGCWYIVMKPQPTVLIIEVSLYKGVLIIEVSLLFLSEVCLYLDRVDP